MSYESPIIMDYITDVTEKIQKDQEVQILTKIRTLVDVDREELIKALQYDRNQYEQGYKEGYSEAIENVRKKLKEVDVEFNYLDNLIEILMMES